jgi:hypothetical protein
VSLMGMVVVPSKRIGVLAGGGTGLARQKEQ